MQQRLKHEKSVSVTFNLKCMCLKENDKTKTEQHPFLKKKEIGKKINIIAIYYKKWQKGCVSVTSKIQ